MENRRWWDVAVGAGSAAIAIALLLGLGPDTAAERAVALAAVGALALAYVLIARPGIGMPPNWRFIAFLAAASVVMVVGTAASPFLAMLQVFTYPLVWVLGDSRRRGIIGSAVLAVAVLIGYLIGGGLTVEALAAALTTAGFSFTFAVAFGLWISSIAEYGEERARLLADLTAAQAQIEALSRDRGAAEERERLARDIHDTLAQTLAGLVIFAERAGRQSRDGQADAAATTIATVEQVARDALAETRALVARTAAVPSEPAFAAAVERLVERFRAQADVGQTAVDITLDAEIAEGALDRDAQVVLLRCLQEALSNIAKHAGARRVAVRVLVEPDRAVRLDVSDDGDGFDPSEPATGFGLDGMRERVALAGGRLDVDSARGRGTSLHVSLPAVTGSASAASDPSEGSATAGSATAETAPGAGSASAATAPTAPSVRSVSGRTVAGGPV
ncbi:sensor histidine kinase [Microbacterium allomyrinae]|uniref:Oxygen sensor histidine kinase NreB n=1 Tax=Microbacterium allomyrinae TaxID=2830666 RepID=A0A9X1LTI4_9MICO|nr:sensor histidine kinase [Microbacterium allomyrinae]MCC2031220.1 sensor histidine kinase [Microbacterium allomyrinae]